MVDSDDHGWIGKEKQDKYKGNLKGVKKRWVATRDSLGTGVAILAGGGGDFSEVAYVMRRKKVVAGTLPVCQAGGHLHQNRTRLKGNEKYGIGSLKREP